ncbi:MATE family efflux transporter [Psychrobium sp. 1_MG-2023]|uniref:MATE family efflux transporter n=1 Tax=Psychrobium sp. 1_MG-2023 TaxID=3062624 RepID=UPI000C3370BB|nr:MATE family efflux transporter [Psychrobium sp. 1_MG-2023]MDP2559575.1 MATE family efflux transporter [Psychrobium sp. 1_MG-2023]PKF59562.1 MATE family efflux transporter [Alteromonadales bacterium alter-6D02]
MSIPSGLGILSLLVFNLADTYFVSLLGTEPLAALSFTFPITFIITSILIGLGVGLSASLARIIGQGEQHNVADFVVNALLLGLITAISLSTLGYFSITPLFTAMGAKPSLLPYISDYLQVWYIAILFLVIPMIGNNALRATGNTKFPSILMAVAGLINVILDPIFIFGLGPIPAMGIQGAAVATLFSWALSMVGALILLKRSKLIAWVSLNWQQAVTVWRKVLKIGRPAALSQMINPLANAILMTMIANYDTAAVAAYGVGMRIESLMLIAILALSSSLTPFIAQNLGAGQVTRAKQALIGSAHFSLLCQLGFYLLIAVFAYPIAGLFSDDESVIEYLVIFLWLVPVAYGALGVVILVANSLNAFNRPGSSLLVNMARLFLIMLPMAWLGNILLGATGIFAAIAIANILIGGACYILALKVSEGKAH